MSFLPVKMVAERYGVSIETVWRWSRADKGFPRPISLSPGCTRWRLSDLENWEAAKAGDAEQASLRAAIGGVGR